MAPSPKVRTSPSLLRGGKKPTCQVCTFLRPQAGRVQRPKPLHGLLHSTPMPRVAKQAGRQVWAGIDSAWRNVQALPAMLCPCLPLPRPHPQALLAWCPCQQSSFSLGLLEFIPTCWWPCALHPQFPPTCLHGPSYSWT